MENSSGVHLAANGIVPELGVSLEDLEAYVTRAREGQYLLIAGITLIVYDYFCTLEEEVSFVWGQAPRLVSAKILFALNRYLPIFTLILRFIVFNKALYNAADCNFALLSATGFSGVINVAIVEIVLLLRVWVLYAKKRWIGIALWTFYLICLGLALAIKYLQPHTNLPFVPAPTYGQTGCSKVASGEMFFIYGVVTIAESVFFVMLLFKAYQTSRNSSHTPILTALLKQGTLYYFVVLAILTLTMFAPFSNGLYWPIANAFPIVPIVSIACNRLILSLRGMVFAHSVVRGSAFGMSGSNSNPHSHERAASSSGSGNHPNNGSGSGSGGGHSYLPNIHNKGHSRRVSSPPRQVPRMQIQRSSTIVTFSDDWREGRNHHPLDNAISLDTIPANTRYSHHDQRAAQRPWSEADKPISLHPMAPIRR